jgi:hypothetical protein
LLRTSLLAMLLCILLMTVGNRSARGQQTSAAELNGGDIQNGADIQLRFAWGGGVPDTWRGVISIEKGEFVSSRVLAITPDAPSTVVMREGKLAIEHRISTSYGGVDSGVIFDDDAIVKVRLESGSGASFVKQWNIQDLIDGVNESIDRQQNRISISRVPGDQLRVELNRPHLVFQPSETWKLDASIQRCSFKSQKCKLLLGWTNKDSKRAIPFETIEFDTDSSGSSTIEPIEITMPTEEGVHDLVVEIEPSSKSPLSQFRKTRKLLRKIQLVVISPSRPPGNEVQDWRTVQEFSAQDLRGSMRSSWSLARLRGERAPIHRGKVEIVAVDEEQDDSALELAPDAWVAVPVQRGEEAQDGSPVRISIRYRSIPGTKLGVNHLTPRQDVLHGMDSGLSVPNEAFGSENNEQWLTHEFHLWPNDNLGYVFLSNVSDSTSAQVGNIKIEAGPKRLRDEDVDAAPKNGRQRMAILESPDFSGIFQAQRAVDPQTGQALDDWNTFYDSIDRLVQYLKLNRYTGAFVTVASDGSAIFPASNLAPGPRYDSGVFSSQGSDLIQKDVVELMLRMFEREGLQLVPVLTLNGPLPQLERTRGEGSMSYDLIDTKETTIPFGRKFLPAYNPLDRNLQGVCSQEISRISKRYQEHRSFAGIALSCRPDCYTLLPGNEYGFDSVTLNRFLQSQNLDAANFDRSILLKADNENGIRDAWLTWRSNEMAAWYQDMALSVRGDSNRLLYLLPIDIFQNRELASAMSPSLHRSGDFAKSMRHLGLDPSEAALNSGVVLLSPHHTGSDQPLKNSRVEININQSAVAEQFYRSKTDGVLFAHRGTWRDLNTSESIPGIKSQTRNQILHIAGNESRRRYIRAIRKFDCRLFVDGGLSLVNGDSKQLDSVKRIIDQLPARRFTDIGDASNGPVCMRQFSQGGQHWFYAVNDSPWPVELTATIKSPSPQVLQASTAKGSRIAPLTTLDGKQINVEQSGKETLLRVFLEPWSMYAGTSSADSGNSRFEIDRFEVRLPDDADSKLRKRLYQLKSKLAKARVGIPLTELKNGGFETFNDPNESGWEFGNHDQAEFNLDSSDIQEGRTSLSIKTSGKPVWIRSNVIELTKTGRISVSAWLKTNNPKLQPPLRISLEGTSDGSSVYRFGEVGDSAASGNNPIDSTWRRFAVHFDDLPDDMTNIKIGFDLMNTGQVSIDDVAIHDRWFDENDSVAITQLLASAGSQLQDPLSIDSGQRILENYWVQFLDQHIGNESKVDSTEAKSKSPSFELPIPKLEMPNFENSPLSPRKAKRTFSDVSDICDRIFRSVPSLARVITSAQAQDLVFAPDQCSATPGTSSHGSTVRTFLHLQPYPFRSIEREQIFHRSDHGQLSPSLCECTPISLLQLPLLR